MKPLPDGYTFARALNGTRVHIVRLGNGPFEANTRVRPVEGMATDAKTLPGKVQAWEAATLPRPVRIPRRRRASVGSERASLSCVSRVTDPGVVPKPEELCNNCAARWLGVGNQGSLRDAIAKALEGTQP